MPLEDKSSKSSQVFKNQMNCNYKTDEIHPWGLVDGHIAPTNEDSEIKFHIYYETRKLSKLLIQNNRNIVDGYIKFPIYYKTRKLSKLLIKNNRNIVDNPTLQHHVFTGIYVKGMDVAPFQHNTSEQQHVRCMIVLRCIPKTVP